MRLHRKSQESVKWFAELWASGRFDCGPQDYEFMVRQTSCVYPARLAPSFLLKARQGLPVPASASDEGGTLAESCLHTNARHRFVIESQSLECSQVAAGFAA